MQLRVLAFVLAGGKGTRLYPLTKERAKPAVPFGGRYRIVDFVLSNLLNSGIYSTYVLIQFKSQSLLQHLREGWESGSLLRSHFIIPVPAQMRTPGRELVPRHGRRDLPEHQPDRAGGPARGGHLRRRSHLPHEHPGDDRVPRAEAGAGDHRGDSGPQGGSARVRRHRGGRRRRGAGIPRKERGRAHHAGRPVAGLRLDGQLRLLHLDAAARVVRRRRTAPTARTISAAISCPG